MDKPVESIHELPRDRARFAAAEQSAVALYHRDDLRGGEEPQDRGVSGGERSAAALVRVGRDRAPERAEGRPGADRQAGGQKRTPAERAKRAVFCGSVCRAGCDLGGQLALGCHVVPSLKGEW